MTVSQNNPDGDPPPEWLLGIQAFRDGRLREAADRLGRAAVESELSISLHTRLQTLGYLGAAQYSLGQAAAAVAAFEQALHLAPRAAATPHLLMNLANGYMAIGRRAAARQVLERVVAIESGNAEARMLLERVIEAGDTGRTGHVLGESPESMREFLRTVHFTRVTGNGLDPAQVKLTLGQVERYIESLAQQISEKDAEITRMKEEVAAGQEREESLIKHLISLQRQPQQADADTEGQVAGGDGQQVGAQLSPVELLFRKRR